jgi:hypothetical protein
MPTWSHSFVPFGPRPAPPTPTQAATWPLLTWGAVRDVIAALTPDPVERLVIPA